MLDPNSMLSRTDQKLNTKMKKSLQEANRILELKQYHDGTKADQMGKPTHDVKEIARQCLNGSRPMPPEMSSSAIDAVQK